MNISLLPRDSIAQRFALAVALAVAVTWSLIGLFHVFGGVWAQPALENSGLLDQAANMVRIIEAAPTPIREQLAGAGVGLAGPVDLKRPVIQRGERRLLSRKEKRSGRALDGGLFARAGSSFKKRFERLGKNDLARPEAVKLFEHSRPR